jgi:hypothetical protein
MEAKAAAWLLRKREAAESRLPVSLAVLSTDEAG